MEELSKYILGRINTQQSESKMEIVPPKFSVKKERCCHTNTVTSLHFNNDGSKFLSTSLDGYVIDWDTESFDFEHAYQIGHDGIKYGITNEDNLISTINQDGSISIVDKRSVCF